MLDNIYFPNSTKLSANSNIQFRSFINFMKNFKFHFSCNLTGTTEQQCANISNMQIKRREINFNLVPNGFKLINKKFLNLWYEKITLRILIANKLKSPKDVRSVTLSIRRDNMKKKFKLLGQADSAKEKSLTLTIFQSKFGFHNSRVY